MLTRKTLRIAALGAITALPALGAGVELVPVRVAEGFKGPLFAGASRDGELLVLDSGRGEELVVERSGRARSRLKFGVAAVGNELPALRAVAGDSRWFAQRGAAFWLSDGEQPGVTIPFPRFFPLILAMRDDRPVIQVAPDTIGRWAKEDLPQPGSRVPWLMEWDGSDWRQLVDQVMPDKDVGDIRARQDSAAHVAIDAKGRIYTAHEYRYRIARYSTDGRLLEEVLVGDAKVRHRDKAGTAKVEKELANEIARSGMAHPPSNPATPPGSTPAPLSEVNTALPAVRALAVADDGVLYLVTADETSPSGSSLDRYDGSTGRLERTPLASEHPGFTSLASGKAGLLLANFRSASGGPWLLPWSALEKARWKPVADVVFDPPR